jgi:hypothetical protein
MAEIINKDSNFTMTQKIMRRALEYAYYTNDIQEEIECYDLLGKLSHQNSKLTAATFFINKATLSQTEPKDSNKFPLKKFPRHFQENRSSQHKGFLGIQTCL